MPWGLTMPIAAAPSDASRSAAPIANASPSPVRDGADMWFASLEMPPPATVMPVAESSRSVVSSTAPPASPSVSPSRAAS
ncbi:MAG: hypothetical protein ACLRMJ_04825 [Alistipes finegoldii]